MASASLRHETHQGRGSASVKSENRDGSWVGTQQWPRPLHPKCVFIFLPLSEDYGKNFKDITNLINNTFIRTEFGMAIGPENSGKVRLVRACVELCLMPHLGAQVLMLE